MVGGGCSGRTHPSGHRHPRAVGHLAPLFAVGIAGLASSGSPPYIALVGLLAVVLGVLVALVGILRFGWIAELLSAPIIAGFLAGVAVIIIIHQLPDLLGLPTTTGSAFHRVSTVIGHLQIGRAH